MTIDHSADRPFYKQLADLIRDQIKREELEPGQRLPAEHDYAAEQAVSRDTVRQAMAILRNEGLIYTTKRGSHVRRRDDLTSIRVERGDIYARMPTERERKRHGITEGVPVLIVKISDDDGVEVHPADRAFIRVGLS